MNAPTRITYKILKEGKENKIRGINKTRIKNNAAKIAY
jgi:hypothetical protein